MRYRAVESLLARALGPLRTGLSFCPLGLPPLTVLCSRTWTSAQAAVCYRLGSEISNISAGGSEGPAPAQTQAESVEPTS